MRGRACGFLSLESESPELGNEVPGDNRANDESDDNHHPDDENQHFGQRIAGFFRDFHTPSPTFVDG